MTLNISKHEVSEIIKTNNGCAHEVLVSTLEKTMVEEALIIKRGNQTRAAEVLGINRGTLRRLMMKHGMVK